MAATSRATVDPADEVVVEWNEEDAGMVQRLNQKWLAEIQARGEMLGALRAKRAWLKEDIARQFASLMPRLSLALTHAQRSAEIVGLLATGAAANVLPYPVGATLGADWDQQTTVISLAGSLERVEARAPVLLGLS
jgi:hypothetical protein